MRNFKYFLLVITLILLTLKSSNSLSWWNASWNLKNQIEVQNPKEFDLVDFQIFMNISKMGGMKNDYSDLRFTYYNETEDSEYELPYWFQNYTSNFILVWVRVPIIKAYSNATLYLYYNNTNANYVGNPYSVFYLFDDFNFLNTTIWNNIGSGTNYTINEGLLKVTLFTSSINSFVRSTNFGFKSGVLVYKNYQGDGNPSVASSAWVTPFDTSKRSVGTGTGRVVFYDTYYFSGRYPPPPNTTMFDLYNMTNELFVEFKLGWKPNSWYVNQLKTYYNVSEGKRYGSVVSWNETGIFILNQTYNLTFPNENMYPEFAFHDGNVADFYTLDYVGIANYTYPEPAYSVGLPISLDINIHPSNNVIYGTQTNASCEFGNLYRNGTLVSNPEVDILPAGVWNYTCVYYSKLLQVNKVPLPVNLYLNGTKNANRTYPYQAIKAETDYEALSWNTGIQTQLWRDNVYVGSSEEVFLPQGNYTYKVNATGNWNYTNNMTGLSYTAFVVYPPSVNIQLPTDNTIYLFYNYSQRVIPLNYTSITPYQKECWYSLDNGLTNVTLTNCGNITLTFNSIGNKSVIVYSKEKFTELQNYSVSKFFVDFINYWNITPKDGYVLFSNSTSTKLFTFQNGELYVNTSDIPLGNVTASFYSGDFYYFKKQYYVDSMFNVNDTIELISKKIKINVFDEVSQNRLRYWKSIIMGGYSQTSNGTQYISVGKGKDIRPLETFELVDNNYNTYVTITSPNQTYYFIYNLGFQNGKFKVLFDISPNDKGYGLWIDYYDVSLGDWKRVWTYPGNNYEDYFYVNNTIGNANAGDFIYVCNYTICPLFRLQRGGLAGATNIKVYEIELLEPYQYNQYGQLSFNFTDMNITGNNLRLMFQGYGTQGLTKQRTLFLSQYGLESDAELNVYLTSECYSQPLQVLSSTSLPSQNLLPISNATISLYRNIGGKLVLIEQQRTDETGLASICVLQGVPYVLVVSANNYGTETIYDIVFTQTQILYLYLNPLPSIRNITNPHNIQLNITPIGNKYEPFNISCYAVSNEESVLYSYINVTQRRITSDYLNITSYPPKYSNETLPFNYTIEENPFYYDISYSSIGSLFMKEVTEKGIYSITCGIVYNVSNKEYKREITNEVWLLASGMAPKGRELTKYMSPTTLYVIMLVLNMLISSFFINKFGLGSGFIFLLIWGMILTILSGWGLNIQTGLFFLGTLVWIGYIILKRGGI